MKFINVVSFADENLASFRLRQKVVAEWINTHSPDWRMTISQKPDPKADINLFHKHKNHNLILAWVKDLRLNSETRIIFDVSDNWFDDKKFGPFYQDMLVLSDCCTTSSLGLMKRVVDMNLCARGVIFEPTQLQHVTEEVRKNSKRTGKYVWMGHIGNFKELVPHLDKYKDDLTIISNVNPNIKGVKFIPWYQGAEEKLLEYEVCLLPQKDIYKSPNRLVDAYYAGCEVETFGAECYKDFVKPSYKEFFEDGDAELFTIESIGTDWVNLFEYVINSVPRKTLDVAKETKVHPVLEGKKYVKLNLGCGIKVYPKKEGWVNIDLINVPDLDLIADVRTVNTVLGNDVADEVHAYHVIEHIYPQELLATLKNWYDVLKPGGKIVLELPCFLKAAKNILQLETTKDRNMWMDLGLKAFYGDYDPFKPNVQLDLHKWAWTFQTLKEELARVGFIDMVEEVPVTHRRERDFRIVGFKPKDKSVNNDN